MISALCYLQFHSLKNRLVLRFKRLKQPKYLVGALVGGLYFYWYFFRFLFARPARPGRWNAGAPVLEGLPADPRLYESLGALVLFLLVFVAWFFPRKRAALTFTEAEVAFLFPAPVTRRGLIHFKLLRSQLGLLFTVLVFTLLSGRFAAGGHWLTHAAGWWIILFTLNLHFLGSSFALTMLMDRGISTWKRRGAVMGLVLAALAAVITWAAGTIPDLTTARLTDLESLTDYARRVLVSGPLPYLLYPFRLVLRPYLAPDGLAFVNAVGPALLLMGAHYWWVIRADVAFEEASVEASQKMAEKIAAARAGKLGAAGKPRKRKRPPFPLRPVGAPLVALLWKNLISAGAGFTMRTWGMLAVLVLVMGGSLMSTSAAGHWAAVIGLMAGLFGFWAILFGPQVMRQDFRQDLPQADVLKLYPLRGWQMALGEILAPAVILTAVEGLLVLLGLACAASVAPESFPRALLLALGAGVTILLPMLNLISLVIPNAAVLLFPSWFQTGKEAPQGVEATGQRLIFALGQFLAFLVALLPAAAGFGMVFFPVNWLGGPVPAVLAAAVAAALVLAVEAGLGVLWLGWLFERFDVSAEPTA
jgi:ABC-2 type transport system permease protein